MHLFFPFAPCGLTEPNKQGLKTNNVEIWYIDCYHTRREDMLRITQKIWEWGTNMESGCDASHLAEIALGIQVLKRSCLIFKSNTNERFVKVILYKNVFNVFIYACLYWRHCFKLKTFVNYLGDPIFWFSPCYT